MFPGRVIKKKAASFPKRSGDMDAQFKVTRDKVVYEPLLIQDLGGSCCRCVSDVDLLFNQQRLDRMSLQALQQKLNEQAQLGDNGLSELRKNIKDEDLHRFIKSRYIQSLSELRAWSGYLAERYGDTVTGIRNYLALLQKPAEDSNNGNGSADAAE